MIIIVIIIIVITTHTIAGINNLRAYDCLARKSPAKLGFFI